MWSYVFLVIILINQTELDAKVCLHSTLTLTFPIFIQKQYLEFRSEISSYHNCGYSIWSKDNNCRYNICFVSLSQNCIMIRKIHRLWPKSCQFWGWLGFISMHILSMCYVENAPKTPKLTCFIKTLACPISDHSNYVISRNARKPQISPMSSVKVRSKLEKSKDYDKHLRSSECCWDASPCQISVDAFSRGCM